MREAGTDGEALGAIERAVAERRSIRAFLPDPVDRRIVERILDLAARAPSGTNMQPWRAYVLAGEALRDLSDALRVEHEASAPSSREAEYRYYPDPFFEPYLGRRRKVGFDLYGLLGIGRGETEKMSRQHGRNLLFFDAPVGLVFTIDRRLEIGSWLDYGMFLENIMVLARAHGLETCVQAAFAPFHETIRRKLTLDATEVIVCGMSARPRRRGRRRRTACAPSASRPATSPPSSAGTRRGRMQSDSGLRASAVARYRRASLRDRANQGRIPGKGRSVRSGVRPTSRTRWPS